MRSLHMIVCSVYADANKFLYSQYSKEKPGEIVCQNT